MKANGRMRGGDNADLWRRLHGALEGATCRVTKVKGHAKQRDVDSGRVRPEDKLGNDGADALAVRGAKSRMVPAHLVQRAEERRDLAQRVHRMMLEITKARRAHIAIWQGDQGAGTPTDLSDDLPPSPRGPAAQE